MDLREPVGRRGKAEAADIQDQAAIVGSRLGLAQADCLGSVRSLANLARVVIRVSLGHLEVLDSAVTAENRGLLENRVHLDTAARAHSAEVQDLVVKVALADRQVVLASVDIQGLVGRSDLLGRVVRLDCLAKADLLGLLV